MSSRFEAETLLRAAASGAFPSKGEILIRAADGWRFGPIAVEDIETVVMAIIDRIDDRLILSSAIAYEDEVNVFDLRNTFSDLRAPDHEARMRFNRR